MIGYRRAGREDAATLHILLQALLDHDGGGATGAIDSLLAHGFGARPLFDAILAEKGASAVGMVLYYPDYSTQRGEPGVYVQDIYVSADCRGHGVGRGLLARAAADARSDWGASYLTLGVAPGNASARRFYAAQGFRPRGYDFLILDGVGLAALMAP